MKIKGLKRFSNFELLVWLSILLLIAGDVLENPGPDLNNSFSSFGSGDNSLIIEDFKNALSFVHYNVQSFFHKKDILEGELQHFDILSFTETWLSNITDSSCIHFENYSIPFRKDRGGDNHGGILVHVKSYLPAIRRADLEVYGIECLWLELKVKSKRILFGTFYRPPNASPILTLKTQLDLPMILALKILSLQETSI